MLYFWSNGSLTQFVQMDGLNMVSSWSAPHGFTGISGGQYGAFRVLSSAGAKVLGIITDVAKGILQNTIQDTMTGRNNEIVNAASDRMSPKNDRGSPGGPSPFDRMSPSRMSPSAFGRRSPASFLRTSPVPLRARSYSMNDIRSAERKMSLM